MSRPLALMVLGLSVLLLGIGCSPKSGTSKTRVVFWHFWYEDKQNRFVDSLIAEFETDHPEIDVDVQRLQWSEGKTKLMLGLQGSGGPDLVHLGLEWIPEFADGGALLAFSKASASSTAEGMGETWPASFRDAYQEYFAFALPWMLSTRALMIWSDAFGDVIDLEGLSKVPAGVSRAGFGINSYEPHNVLKKSLPFLWAYGSRAFQRNPIWESIDSASVKGLTLLCSLVKSGRLESSRRLDEMFINHQLAAIISGPWLAESIGDNFHMVVAPFPGVDAREYSRYPTGVLSGDFLSVSSKSRVADSALILARYLSSRTATERFATSVPDAGTPPHYLSELSPNPQFFANPRLFFPIDTASKAGSLPKMSRVAAAFALQALLAKPICPHPRFLDIEKIFESEVMEALYGRKSPERAIDDARQAIKALEVNQSNQNR